MYKRQVPLFHRIHPDWPPVARALELQPVSELPPPASPEERRLGALFADKDHFLAFSEHGARELERRFALDPGRVHRVPVGCDHWLRAFDEVPRPDSIPTLLVLGAVRTGRHHAQIAAAFEHLWKKELAGRLLILGHRGDAADAFEAQLSASPAREAVHWIERPREGQLPAVVASASVLVHLSEGELTPVTPLEALSFGRAVVASRLPAFEEALGDEAQWVANAELGDGPEPLVEALERALESAGDLFAESRRRALAARFTWAAHAAATVDVWRAILADGRP